MRHPPVDGGGIGDGPTIHGSFDRAMKSDGHLFQVDRGDQPTVSWSELSCKLIVHTTNFAGLTSDTFKDRSQPAIIQSIAIPR